jgi:hypothetical protein
MGSYSPAADWWGKCGVTVTLRIPESIIGQLFVFKRGAKILLREYCRDFESDYVYLLGTRMTRIQNLPVGKQLDNAARLL